MNSVNTESKRCEKQLHPKPDVCQFLSACTPVPEVGVLGGDTGALRSSLLDLAVMVREGGRCSGSDTSPPRSRSFRISVSATSRSLTIGSPSCSLTMDDISCSLTIGDISCSLTIGDICCSLAMWATGDLSLATGERDLSRRLSCSEVFCSSLSVLPARRGN